MNIAMTCLFSIFQVRVENHIPESIWAAKREDIAEEICCLGTDYRQKVRDGWVRYLSQKNAGDGMGQISWRAEASTNQKIVLGDND